jgi:preprotein translocase subunit SecA
MFGFLKRLFGGSKQDRDIKALRPTVIKINEEFAKLQNLTNDELRQKTFQFRGRIAEYLKPIDDKITELRQNAAATDNVDAKQGYFESVDKLLKDRDKEVEVVLNELLPQAFAVVKETARRFSQTEVTSSITEFDQQTIEKIGENAFFHIENEQIYWHKTWLAAGSPITWDMVHYDVQLMGGVVLHQGKVAEMATGEGKTLVATLPAYLNALAGEGVHIITVNNYLSQRDSEWMRPVFSFLFLNVDCIDKYQPNSPERKRAYLADVTYGTNNEFGFDYLRDNMVNSAEEIVQRKYHYAMVDEADSVLIDDARTPLIISGPARKDNQTELYQVLKHPVEALVEAQKQLFAGFLQDAKKKIAAGDTKHTEGGGGLSLFRAYRALPKNRALKKYLSETGIKTILTNTENQYLSEQGKNMRIADAPLLFVIEEKNRSVELTDIGADFLGRGNNDANLFVMENIGSVLADIDNSNLPAQQRQQLKDKAIERYSMKSERIHALQQLLKAYSLFDKEEEYVVMEGKVKIVDEQTGRILDGRRYSDGLHQAIEAKENVVIEKPSETYATVTLQNFFLMYHKLCGMTGTAETEAQELWDIYKLDVVVTPTNRVISRKDQNDLVYKTDREKYNAVIAEIEKLVQAGRPVLVGTTSVQNSETLSRLLDMRKIKHNVLNAKQHAREAEIVAEAGQTGQVTIATNMAGRGTDIKINGAVRQAGGLAIIGTERHDSRRVDRQLRGRAGRQGDVGSSQFYVSLEDKLMRLFGSDRIASLMDKLGHKDGDVLQHGMITKSIERAQKKVEENNFGVRKRLLDYDNVMQTQRQAIYKRRNNALKGDRLAIDLDDMIYALSQELATSLKRSQNFQIFEEDCLRYFGFEPQIRPTDIPNKDANALTKALYNQASELYNRKFTNISETILPVILNLINQADNRFVRIAIPFTDGQRGLQVSADLQQAALSNGKSLIVEIQRSITLALLDNAWKEHLRDMEELREQVSSASFAQKDPLVIYKEEAYKLFAALMSKINKEIVSFLFLGGIPQAAQQDDVEFEDANEELAEPEQLLIQQQQQAQQQAQDQQRKLAEQQAQRAAQEAQHQAALKNQPFVKNQQINRNDPCPCGSGKKYKNCHGQ